MHCLRIEIYEVSLAINKNVFTGENVVIGMQD
jgi:hypothetical protein